MVTLASISANAVVPDQLVNYVSAIGGMQGSKCGACLLYQLDDSAVLVGYPPHNPGDMAEVNKSVDLCLARKDIREFTVLAPKPPGQAPQDCKIHTDVYWQIQMPLVQRNAKTRNMLKRANSELLVETDAGEQAWKEEHKIIVEEFCLRKKDQLTEADRYIFRHLESYLAQSPDAVLYSARNRAGKLNSCAIADFTSFGTAFYMFAFRSLDATPGASDLLLFHICQEAARRGHERVNLGLGIDKGVAFFKKKWGATQWLPLAETSWTIPKKSWFSNFFKGKS